MKFNWNFGRSYGYKTIKIVNNSRNNDPTYETENSSGIDLRADVLTPHHAEELDAFKLAIPCGERRIISTGIHVEIPKGYEGQVRSRSGLAAKQGVFVLNSPGTIDSDYRGEIKVILQNLGVEAFFIEQGDRIAQLVFSPVEQFNFEKVFKLKETERGSGGFGSTGKN